MRWIDIHWRFRQEHLMKWENLARYELEEDALTFAQALFPPAPQEAGTG